MNKRAVVLLSGGLDSATTLAIASSEGHECHCLSFDYGQRHAVELDCARIQAGGLPHFIASPAVGEFGGSALTAAIDVPKHDSADELDSSVIPATYVPARNVIFLAYALGYAQVVDADHIWLGVNALDYSGYPDCRPEFIDAFEAMANVATERTASGHRLRIHAPLIYMSKRAIVERGRALGVDFARTHSCYDPDADGRACGHCDSCLLRLRAFEETGRPDPAPYAVAAR